MEWWVRTVCQLQNQADLLILIYSQIKIQLGQIGRKDDSFLFCDKRRTFITRNQFLSLMSLGWVGEDNKSQCCTIRGDAVFSHVLLCFTKVSYYCVQLRNISGDTHSVIGVSCSVWLSYEWKQKLTKITSHGVETRIFTRAVESCIQLKSTLMFCEMLYFKELCKLVTLGFDCEGTCYNVWILYSIFNVF